MKNLFILFATLMSFMASAQNYTADLAKRDFFVNGVMANDSLEMVNFLICFTKNTNLGTFVGAGTYKALIDEEACNSATGEDSTAEKSAATASSAATAATSSDNVAVETVSYKEYLSTVTRIAANGGIKSIGWLDVETEVGIGGVNYEIIAQAYVNGTVISDVSATNPYGVFSMTYDIRNKAAFGPSNAVAANQSMQKGYLSVSGTQIQYTEQMPIFDRRLNGITINNSSDTLSQALIASKVNLAIGSGFKVYQLLTDVSWNKTTKVFCQKFRSAQEWSIVSGVIAAETGSVIGNDAFETLVNSSSGQEHNATTKDVLYDEHCWSTDATNSKRTVYEYGTYQNTTAGPNYDAALSSMSLRAANGDNAANSALSSVLYAHAGYWGTHVDSDSRAAVTDSIVWKNERNTSDSDLYNLKKDYVRVEQIDVVRNSLVDLDKVSFQAYVGRFKREQTWATKFGTGAGNLGFPSTGSCNNTDRNCEEYSGNISVSGSTVTFNITGGMDYSAGVEPFQFSTPFSFTSANWAAIMIDNSYVPELGIWDDQNRRYYNVTGNAMANPSSSTAANQIVSRKSTLIKASDLPSNLACIERCLDADLVNDVMGAGLKSVDTNSNTKEIALTPFKNVGPHAHVAGYYDTNGDGDKDSGETFVFAAGTRSQMGGIKYADRAQYTVASGVIKDGSTDFTWQTSVAFSLPSATTGYNVQSKIDGLTRETEDKLREFQFKEKPASWVQNQNRGFYGSIDMTVFEDNSTNKAALECEKNSSDVYHGYDLKFKESAAGRQNQSFYSDTDYLCGYQLYRGAVARFYRIGLKTRADYQVYNQTDSVNVNISPPETFKFVVPASGVKYNFTGLDYAGQTFLLRFEGFGRLENIPGRVYNKCTGATLGKYVTSWNNCLRYVHDFVIPDGTVLTNNDASAAQQAIKVLAFRGDDFLSKLGTNPATTYSSTTSIAATSNLQDLGLSSDADYIGAVPASGIINSGNPSVVHGTTVATP